MGSEDWTNAGSSFAGVAWRVGPFLVVAAIVLVLGLPLLLGDRLGPAVVDLEDVDVIARVEAQGRQGITVPAADPYELDVLRLDVVEQMPVAAGAPVPLPQLEATVDVAVLQHASWWEDGAEDGELVVFLKNRPRSAGPAWTLVFAVDARTGDITGEFDDDESREVYRSVATNAGARTPDERVDALVAWVVELAGGGVDAWTVGRIATTYLGTAVAGDAVVERDEPFDLAAWQARPADERLLPLGPDDPALDVLQPRLGLRSVAVAVAPNAAFDEPVTEVALEFVGIGLLGWIPLRDGVPTGLVGAAPVGDDVRVRVLGRGPGGEVRALPLFGDEVGRDQATPVTWISAGLADPGPWALVIGLEATSDVGSGVSVRETSIDELGLLMQRAGR